jgi:AcrR family transcriptional regulator
VWGLTVRQPTQRDLQAETRRTQLLDIALTLFAERGVENVSIKDLATEAEVAQGLIYYYFKSKDELLAAVFQQHNPLPEFEAIIRQIADLPAREGLLFFARHLVILLNEKRPVLRLLVRELLSPRSASLVPVLSMREEVMTQLGRYFQSRVAAGELRPHEPLVPIQILVGSLLTLSLLDQPLEPFVVKLVDTVLEGIQAR